jgi:FtsH-binding integral membrane protein
LAPPAGLRRVIPVRACGRKTSESWPHCALALYLDFINLLMLLFQLFGQRSIGL